jgi:hypothetical protein
MRALVVVSFPPSSIIFRQATSKSSRDMGRGILFFDAKSTFSLGLRTSVLGLPSGWVILPKK